MTDKCQTCGCKLGRTVKTPIDRSLGFTAMLELYPGFGQMPDTEGMGITTAFLEDWHKSGHTDMYAYAREWVAARTAPEHEHTWICLSPEQGPGASYGCQQCSERREGAEIESGYRSNTPEHRVWATAQENGKAAASWVFDGNTPAETYRYFLRGIEDGDPAVLDSVRSPDLSGEMGDEYTEDQLMADAGWVPHDGTDMRDELATQYNDEVSAAFWHEVERLARQGLES